MRSQVWILLLSLVTAAILSSQTPSPINGKRYPRLAVRNVMIVDGNGAPASGPKDILIEDNRIVAVVPLNPVAL